MLELFRFVLSKLNFIEAIELVRKRNNRAVAARLHLIVVYCYEIIELYGVILDELKAALDQHGKAQTIHTFRLNPSRMLHLLARQSSNLEIMDNLVADLAAEVRLLDPDFAKSYRTIVGGKGSVLMDAQMILREGHFPLDESFGDRLEPGADGKRRSLWFTSDRPNNPEQDLHNYLYLQPVNEADFIDINAYDDGPFFKLLQWYFEKNDPHVRLQQLSEIAESYRNALAANFTLADILSDIQTVNRYDNWSK